MADIHFTVPTTPTLLLSLLFSLLLLATIRSILVLSTRTPQPDNTEKQPQHQPLHQHHHRRSLSWHWRWEGLPVSAPVFRSPVLTEPGTGHPPRTVTPNHPPSPVHIRTKTPGPAFDHPLPALYETEVPASMAKMIMSRHTIRKPTTPRPPRRSPAPAATRLQSMV